MIKFAIAGMGIRGNLFSRIISQHRDTQLVAVCDLRNEIAKKTSKLYKVKGYTDWRHLLDQEEVDAAYIATPDDAHRGPAVLAAERGLNLLIEKPLATSMNDCIAIKKAVQKAGVKGSVVFHNRWNPSFIRAKEAIDSGELGKIISLNVRANDTLYVPTQMLPWASRSSPAWFLLSHAFDLALWLTGAKAHSIFAKGIKSKLVGMGIDTYDLIHTMIEFSDGVIGLFETTWVLPDSMPSLVDVSWEIIGDEGAFYVNQHEQMVRKATRERFSFPMTISDIDIHGVASGREFFVFESFIKSIRENSKPVVTIEETIEVTRIIEGLHRSIKEKKPLHLER